MHKLRALIQQNQVATGIIAAVILVIAMYFAIRPPAAPPLPQVPFIDYETGEESMHDITEIPPLPGKGGRPTVVRAHYYEGEGEEKVLAYLTRFNSEAQAILKRQWQIRTLSLSAADQAAVDRGGEYRLPAKDSPWLPASPEMMTSTTIRRPPAGSHAP